MVVNQILWERSELTELDTNSHGLTKKDVLHYCDGERWSMK